MGNHMVGAVYVFLIQDGRHLVVQRQNTGYADGHYSVIAGHMEPGESPKQAIIREALEEAGILLDREHLQLTGIMQRPSREQGEERIDFFFACDKWTGLVDNMEPDKCSEFRWISLSDPFPEPALSYVQRAWLKSQVSTELWFDDLDVECVLPLLFQL